MVKKKSAKELKNLGKIINPLSGLGSVTKSVISAGRKAASLVRGSGRKVGRKK